MTYFAKIHKTGFEDLKPEKSKKKGKKPIKKSSDKGAFLIKELTKKRKIFLSLPENKNCFIEGCRREANTIEHRAGRKGYADKWARENDIPLIIDERFFAPCCIQHNQELENNPALSKKYQLSKIHLGKKG